MSECVVRMEMPKNYCEMSVEINGVGDWCPIMAGVCDYNSTKKMPDWCPILCQLPEGHGRLVDADALLDHIVHNYCDDCDDYNGLRCRACPHDDDVQCIEDAPTIVPAAERSET